MKFFRITGKSFLDFFRDDGLMLAGAMSYFSMMALLPFCLFLITLFGYFLGHYHEFYRFFLTKLVNFFPSVTHEVTDELLKLISYKGIGKFSLVLYGLLSYQVFASLEKALNVIFKVKIQRHFFSSLLISLLVVTSIITLLITSFAAASFIHLFKTFQILELSVEISRMNEIIIGFALPFILVLLTVTMIYMLMPKTRVRFADAFKGAFFATVLLEAAKHLFTWYVGTVAQFGRIYGPLSAFVVFLLWVFYTSSIFLIGAEVVHNLGNFEKKR